tara:strand:- start:834 stop:1166 length:333 start_codon:yes stop_codon:yes gene_type:complete
MIFLFRWFEKNQKQQAQTTRDATRIRRAINKTSKTFTESKMKTVKDLAQERYPGETFDYALPHSWLSECLEKGLDPRGQMVWLYDSDGGIMGRPAPLTSEGDKILSVLAR